MNNRTFEVQEVNDNKYGIFENGELKLICNSKVTADTICAFMTLGIMELQIVICHLLKQI